MGFFSFSNPWWWVLVFLCILIIILDKLFFSKIMGIMGEHWTKKELKKLPSDYKVFNDILIKVDGKTHQIDHIVVSKYGIFVIETKHYHGYITGSKYDKKWIRHLGRKKLYYTNPILQNYGHIVSLSSLLNIDKDKIFNIVCISSEVKINIKDDGETVKIVKLIDKITNYKQILIDNTLDVENTIYKSNIIDKKERRGHVESVKNSKVDYTNKCPICGNDLVKKNGKYGEFLGCSNYPKCTYTKR